MNGSGVWSDSSAAGILIAQAQANLHDPAGAELALHTLSADQHNVVVLGVLPHIIRSTLAMDAGHKESATTEFSAIGSMAPASPVVVDLISKGQADRLCSLARVAEAQARLPRPIHCCGAVGPWIAIGILATSWMGAMTGRERNRPTPVQSRWRPICQPATTGGEPHWQGTAILTEPIAKLQAANERGPHWADPLKAWGDVLVKQGHPQEALAKYDEALKYAPNWKQLKEARDTVAKQRS